MPSRYIVCYDVADDRRRAALFKALGGYGDHLQYSVFRCDLSERQHALMIAAIDPLIDHGADQVLVIDLGPVDGRAERCVAALGRSYAVPVRRAIIV